FFSSVREEQFNSSPLTLIVEVTPGPSNLSGLCLFLCSLGQRTITAEPGDTVTLTCRAPSSTKILALQWTRPDLDPEYLFVYENGQSLPENQHPSFKERVELKDSHMKDGDVSVTLKDVTFTDTGTYEFGLWSCCCQGPVQHNQPRDLRPDWDQD
uniref:Ig-like domain-containing protein n=1 Tax=Mastacembelus armatus TaxID=205130 RepID=A0A3Q3M5B1_9TELE